MKLMLGFIFLLFGFIECYAQGKVLVDGVNINEQPIEYISITESGRGPVGKIAVVVDYGQKNKFELLESRVITGDESKPMGFESLTGALNFMYQNGWEVVSIYTIIVGSDITSQKNEIYYLLRRKK